MLGGGLGEESLYMYPVEWKGEVVAVFHENDVEPIEMFRLDRSRMAWEKLEELKDGAMFQDRKQVIARPPCQCRPSPRTSVATSCTCQPSSKVLPVAPHTESACHTPWRLKSSLMAAAACMISKNRLRLYGSNLMLMTMRVIREYGRMGELRCC